MNDSKGAAAPAHAAAGPNPARTDVVWEALRTALERLEQESAGPLEIVDAGGGTGGAAVPLAELGHRVTVVDPSPDSLAALERRAAEAGVVVRAVQGETRDLAGLVEEEHAHLVLVHNVLEFVDDPSAALHDVERVTRRGGLVSLLVTNAVAAVLHRALAGHPEEAHRLLESPEGRWGEGDPVPRRFTTEQILHLVGAGGGFEVLETRGVRVFTDLLPGRAADGDPHTAPAMLDLERAASRHSELAGIATLTHVLVERR